MKQISVVAAVMHFNDKYYIFRRPMDKSFGGQWEFPGGKIETGESNQEALVREIQEELGLIISPGPLLINTSYEASKVIINISFYDVQLDSEIDPVLNEHMEMKVVSKDSYKELDWAPADVEALETIFKHSK